MHCTRGLFLARESTMPGRHVPVLANEIENLAKGCSRFVDCTVGDGGHAARLLELGGKLLAIDRDPDAISNSRERLGAADVQWVNASYSDPAALRSMREFQPDFVLFDLGVSSRQIDTDSRGFSFRRDVPLDMRMTPSIGVTGADLLNTMDGDELTRIFREYADEPKAKRLANEIVRRRKVASFITSDDLVNAVRGALGARTGPADFARLFQAVRIEVNGEIRALEATLPVVLDALAPSGIVAVISYHSVEDRVVKSRFRDWSRECVCPPELPVCRCRGCALGTLITRKPISASEEEVHSNPRARSARLRAFRKSHAS
jgi:16S rRNA (cytosine1402-N4)-methyltransferase